VRVKRATILSCGWTSPLKPNSTGLAYRIGTDGTGIPRLEWEPEAIEIDAETALTPDDGRGEHSERNEAAAYKAASQGGRGKTPIPGTRRSSRHDTVRGLHGVRNRALCSFIAPEWHLTLKGWKTLENA